MTIEITPSQQQAAQLLIELSEMEGRQVDESVRAIANASFRRAATKPSYATITNFADGPPVRPPDIETLIHIMDLLVSAPPALGTSEQWEEALEATRDIISPSLREHVLETMVKASKNRVGNRFFAALRSHLPRAGLRQETEATEVDHSPGKPKTQVELKRDR